MSYHPTTRTVPCNKLIIPHLVGADEQSQSELRVGGARVKVNFCRIFVNPCIPYPCTVLHEHV